jgi:hypothetical protein
MKIYFKYVWIEKYLSPKALVTPGCCSSMEGYSVTLEFYLLEPSSIPEENVIMKNHLTQLLKTVIVGDTEKIVF